MSIRARLTLWIVSTMALLLCALGATVYYRARADLLRAVDRDLQERGGRMVRFAARLRGFGGRGGPLALGGPSSGFRPGERGEGRPGAGRGEGRATGGGWRFAPRTMDLDGRVLFAPPGERPWDSTAFAASVQGKTRYTTVGLDEEPVRVLSQPVRVDGKVLRVVQVAHPLADTYQALQGLTRTLLTLIPVALLGAAVGGAVMIDRVLRPVRQIAHAAKDIGGADLAMRLPVGGRDEFSDLALTFNAMLGRLQAAFARREEALERQRRFTGDASHELQTPLAIVKANTTLTLSSPRAPEDYQAALQAIDGAADHMNRIVQDLLMLARSDGGQLAQNITAAPLGDLLARAMGVLHSDQSPITVQIAPGLQVVGNDDELTRLFANLLENAARHTPPEGRISVSAREENGDVRITVEDTGEGIPPEHLPHVCERFYRIESSRTRNGGGGTGLGLSICKSIVEAHDGTMEIFSSVGNGTTVQVVLPALSRA